jgi:EpsD family peptidyl-prolyl cis-trans isomerase
METRRNMMEFTGILGCRSLIRAFPYALLLGLCGTLLVDCSRKPEATGGPVGQVIAHVGKQDVTISELENEFRVASVPPDRRNDEIVKRVLGDLAKRKYFAQKALISGLDREPNTLLEMMRAREQVLATAYVQRGVSTKSSGIGNAEIDQYIAAHPLKFAKRIVMTIDQITIPLTGNVQAVVDATRELNSLEDIDRKLSELGVLHTRSTGLLNSGDVPEDFFKAVQEKKTDDVVFVRSGPTTGTFFKSKGDDASYLARRMLVAALYQEEAGAPASDIEIKYEYDYARIMAKQEPQAGQEPKKGQPEEKREPEEKK